MEMNTGLYIEIPTPCSQNWDAMSAEDGGRYCMQCNNIVYDFSQMSDAELFDFFKNSTHKPCGRFDNSQLKRNILPRQRPIVYFKKLHKIAAAVLTFASLKTIPAAAEKKGAYSFEKTEEKKTKITSISDTIVISVNVKDEFGKAFAGVAVNIGDKGYGVTDSFGTFSFKVDQTEIITGSLYFIYPGYVTIVRSYHMAMGDTKYNIQMSKYSDNNSSFLMGVPVFPSLEDLPVLQFKTGVYTLTDANKIKLASVAAKLKALPFAGISLQIYFGAEKKQNIYAFREKNIRKYLVEKEGISDSRINTQFEAGGNKNTVDIKSNY